MLVVPRRTESFYRVIGDAWIFGKCGGYLGYANDLKYVADGNGGFFQAI
jgi:hypothetical protein